MLSFALLTVTLFAAALAAEKRAVVPSQPGLPSAFLVFFFFFAIIKKKKKKKKKKKRNPSR
jgi:preprotein translocase subunit YajC